MAELEINTQSLQNQMFQQLVNQVNVLNSTLGVSLERLNTAFNLFQDRASELQDLTNQLIVLKDNLETGLEALHRSISESDQQIDDLAKITVRVGQMEQTYQQALQQAQG